MARNSEGNPLLSDKASAPSRSVNASGEAPPRYSAQSYGSHEDDDSMNRHAISDKRMTRERRLLALGGIIIVVGSALLFHVVQAAKAEDKMYPSLRRSINFQITGDIVLWLFAVLAHYVRPVRTFFAQIAVSLFINQRITVGPTSAYAVQHWNNYGQKTMRTTGVAMCFLGGILCFWSVLPDPDRSYCGSRRGYIATFLALILGIGGSIASSFGKDLSDDSRQVLFQAVTTTWFLCLLTFITIRRDAKFLQPIVAALFGMFGYFVLFNFFIVDIERNDRTYTAAFTLWFVSGLCSICGSAVYAYEAT
eukprot:m.54947 g.54947  ORF g.54947 m.54947 type:complete len:307 (-) comp6883_c0_seq1:3456-4376(-)